MYATVPRWCTRADRNKDSSRVNGLNWADVAFPNGCCSPRTRRDTNNAALTLVGLVEPVKQNRIDEIFASYTDEYAGQCDYGQIEFRYVLSIESDYRLISV